MPEEKTYIKKLEDHCQKMIEDRDSAIQELISYKKEVSFVKQKVVDNYIKTSIAIRKTITESNKIVPFYTPDKVNVTISTILFDSHKSELEHLLSQIYELEKKMSVEVEMDNRELERRININTDAI